MIIRLKNKDMLIVGDFIFKCCIVKNGLKKHKIEGDGCTPKGTFKFDKLYYRNDREIKPITNIKIKKIKKTSGWCNDPKNQFYNKEIKIKKKVKHEKLFRRDYKYNYLITIKYNTNKIIPYKGSAIFLHLTKNFKPTAGCIAVKKNDFLVLAKLINKNSKIIIN